MTAKEVKEEQTRKTIEKIRRILPEGRVLENEPMSLHTSFRIGGPAAALVTCCNEEELSEVLKLCSADEGIEHMLIGNGSNFLVSDDGYPGIMVKLGGDFGNVSIVSRDTYEDDSVLVRAGAARLLSSVSAFLADHGYLVVANDRNLTNSVEISYSASSVGSGSFDIVPVPQYAAEKTVSLYPNPAREQVSFTLESDAQVSIFDMTGRKVSETNVAAGQAQLDVNELVNGVYFVNFRFADGTTAVSKFVKF